MLRYTVIVMVFAVPALTGYAGSSDNNVNQGQSSGSSYGYSGSYAGNGPPNFPLPQIPQFDFSGLLGGYLESLSKYHQDFINKGGGAFSYSFASSSNNNARVNAQSSLTFSGQRDNRVANPQNLQGGYGQPGGFPAASGFGSGYGSGSSFGGSFSGSSGGAGVAPSGYGAGGPTSGGASASASIGPQGVRQMAGVFPENPNTPNVDIHSRFGESATSGAGGGGGGGGGQYSVFTSSVSHSSNVDGKPKTFHQASTTVNDNGKVTTYTVKNP